jgi:hypothetical protein
MTHYIEIAEAQMCQCQKQFNIEWKKMYEVRKSLPPDQQLSPVMIDLIEQRVVNIGACLKCMYKFKAQLCRINTDVQ